MEKLTFIIVYLLAKAMESIEDAEYDNQAQITFKNDFVLINKKEFQEIVDFLEDQMPYENFPRKFSDIVKPDEEENNEEGE